MSGGPEPSGDHSPGSAAEPATPASQSCGCQARNVWGTNLGGLGSRPGPALPLLRIAGVPGLGSAPQEKTRSGKKLGRRMPLKIWRGLFSPFSGLDSLGWRQCPPAPRAVLGVLAVGLLACLFMLFSIQARLESLREDLAALRREGMCQASGTTEGRDAPDSRQVGEEGASWKGSWAPRPSGGLLTPTHPPTHPHSPGAILEGTPTPEGHWQSRPIRRRRSHPSTERDRKPSHRPQPAGEKMGVGIPAGRRTL